ncbi:MAG: DUF4153 domain-containing protein [Alphaproteobacteria bacterium]
MLTISFQKVQQELLKTILRFPLVLACCFLFGIIALKKEIFFFLYTSTPPHYLAILFFGGSWFLASKLFAESKNLKQHYYYIFSILIFSILATCIYKLPNISWQSVLLCEGLGCLIFIFPFLNTNFENEQIWAFNYRIIIQLFYAFAVSIILLIGISVILFSLDYLFSITIHSNQFLYSSIIVKSFIAPIIFLSGIPTRFDEKIDKKNTEIIRILLEYVVIPILLIYAVILYAYIIKILMAQSLPRGRIIYLIGSFSCINVLVYLIGNVLDGKLISLFKNHIFKILICPLCLMAFSIYIRINQYGLTEGRYIVSLCLVWLFSIVIFSFIKNRGHLIKFVYLSLSFLTIVGAFGPWSVVNLSTYSQVQRLKTVLQKNELLVDGLINPKKDQNISMKDQKSIVSILRYIATANKTEKIKSWFSKFPDSNMNKRINEYVSPREAYKIADMIAKDIGISNKVDVQYNFHYTAENSEIISTNGYDSVIFLDKNYVLSRGKTKAVALDELVFSLNFDTNVYSIKDKSSNEEIISVNLSDLCASITESTETKTKVKNAGNEREIASKKLTFKGQNSSVAVKLLIREFGGERAYIGNYMNLYHMKAVLLYKKLNS